MQANTNTITILLLQYSDANYSSMQDTNYSIITVVTLTTLVCKLIPTLIILSLQL